MSELGAAGGASGCMVCGDAGPFGSVYSRDGFTLVRCTGCGLVFQDPQPTDDALRRTYYHDGNPDWALMLLGPLRDASLRRARLQLWLLSRAGVGAKGQRLLDVGCADGAFMEVAEHAGWRTTGVELGQATASAARSRGLDVRTGTLRDALPHLTPGSFDLVTFWDVLEHLRDPRDELTLARGLLRPGGKVAATMPNVAGLYPRWTYRLIAQRTGRWEYPELPLHLYDFDPRTITRLLTSSGYRDILVETLATPFGFYRATVLSIEALGGGIRGRALRAAFEALHAVLYPVARWSGRQNSQFVLATKA